MSAQARSVLVFSGAGRRARPLLKVRESFVGKRGRGRPRVDGGHIGPPHYKIEALIDGSCAIFGGTVAILKTRTPRSSAMAYLLRDAVAEEVEA
jgi:hypothetical protein